MAQCLQLLSAPPPPHPPQPAPQRWLGQQMNHGSWKRPKFCYCRLRSTRGGGPDLHAGKFNWLHAPQGILGWGQTEAVLPWASRAIEPSEGCLKWGWSSHSPLSQVPILSGTEVATLSSCSSVLGWGCRRWEGKMNYCFFILPCARQIVEPTLTAVT